MKATVTKPTEINITHIRLELPVRFEDEDIPYDFPLRTGNMWTATVNIDTGEICDWPKGKSAEMYMKVNDEGTYILLDDNGAEVGSRRGNYVPHGVVPGEYGDYVELKINEQGIITNWPKNPDVSAFFEE